MKMIIEFITGFITIVLIFGFSSCKDKLKANENQENEKVNKTKLKENPYLDMRNRAINVTADQLKLSLENDNEIYGVIMDWNMGTAIVTVVSYKTGDASIYLSKGQMFLGGFAHKTVSNAAKEFVNIAGKYISKATKTTSTESSNGNKINFYFLTKSGRYYIEDEIEKIESNKSDLTELNNAGQKVITEYRLITGKP